ncbi:MAG: glutamyl-tRNA reductase [Rhodospirillales bacterium]
MTAPLSGTADLVITGVSHRTGSVGLRDQLFIDDAGIPGVVGTLRAAGAEGVVVVSTCDRVEIVLSGRNLSAVVPKAAELLAGRVRGDQVLGDALYALSGEDALRHLFRVAASLESQVIGEPQVLGQVKAAHRIARASGGVPPGLDAMLQAAYGAAKRVRSETRIGEKPVSLAAAAAAVARDVHGELADASALLIGDGDMGMVVSEYLTGRGIGSMTVSHERAERAEPAARRLNCHVVSYEDLAAAFAESDIVMTAVGRRGYAVSPDMVRAALVRRRYRPLLVLDLAVPGDVDPAVDRMDDVFLFDLANLDALASDGAQSRGNEIPAAEAIVEEAVESFFGAAVEREAVPALTRLRRRVEAVREQALAESAGDAEKATRLMARRLLHAPSMNLRELARDDGMELKEAEKLLDRLFDEGGTKK